MEDCGFFLQLNFQFVPKKKTKKQNYEWKCVELKYTCQDQWVHGIDNQR